MQRCPCCNARLKTESNCPRCAADLTNIFEVQKQAVYWHQQALGHLLDNDPKQCIKALDQSLALQHNQSVALFRQFVLSRKQPIWHEINHIWQETCKRSIPVEGWLRFFLRSNKNVTQQSSTST